MKSAIQKRAKEILLKGLLWISISMAGLVILLFILLQLPQVQQTLTSFAVDLLEKKIHTKVNIKGINIAFPKSLWLQDIYVEDLKSDTLLYGHSIKIDIDMFALLQKEIQINQVNFVKLSANIQRNSNDSSYNFDFIAQSFQDTSKVIKDTINKNPWEFSVKGLTLENSRLMYEDEISGTMAKLYAGKLDLDVDIFELDPIKIHFNEISIESTIGLLELYTISDQQPGENQTTLPDIGFGKLELKNVEFTLNNQFKNQHSNFSIGQSLLDAESIELANRKIFLNNIKVHDANASFLVGRNIQDSTKASKSISSSEPVQAKSPLDLGWEIGISQVALKSLQLKYENEAKSIESEGLDFNHLNISELHGKIKNVKVNHEAVEMDVDEFGFMEHHGFNLHQLTGAIKIHNNGASVSNLRIQSAQSSINMNISGKFRSFGSLKKDLPQVEVSTNIADSRIALSDISYFIPGLKEGMPKFITDTTSILLNATLVGKIGNLNVDNFAVEMLDRTTLNIHGNMAGLPDINQLNFDLSTRLETSKNDLDRVLTQYSSQRSFQLPSKMNMKMNTKGSLADFKSQLDLKTNYGALTADLDIQNITVKNPTYKAEVNIENFATGNFINDSGNLGTLDLALNVNGQGIRQEDINSRFDLTFNQLEFKNYNYRDLSVKGLIKANKMTILSMLNDDNLAFELDGEIDFGEKEKNYHGQFDLQKAFLNELNLSTQDLKLQALISADLSISSSKEIDGDLGIRDFSIFKNNELYRVDSFLVASVNQEGKSKLNVQSDIMMAQFNGTMAILDLGKTIRQHFDQYFDIATIPHENTPDQKFNFSIDVKNTDLLTDVLFPKLNTFEPGEIHGAYNGDEKKLDFVMEVPMIGYGNFVIDSLVLTANSNKENLSYHLSFSHIKDSIFNIHQLDISGNVKDNIMNALLVIQDTAAVEKYRLGGQLKHQNDAYTFQITSDDLVLNYDNWQLPKNHFIQLGSTGFEANNFIASQGEQQLALHTQDRNLSVKFADFNLKTISGLVEGDKRIFGGIIDGNMELNKNKNFTSLSADLTLETVQVRDDTIGNIDLILKNEQQHRYDVNAQISGNGNEVEIDGYYFVDPTESETNLNLNLQRLKLETIETFVANTISQAGGNITGKMKISGNFSEPLITGDLRFSEAFFEVDYLGTKMHVNDQAIDFSGNKVTFTDFIIRDVNDQPFTMDGVLDINDITNPLIDLNISANNFLALNTTGADNDQYYGKMLLSTQTSVNGPLDELDIFVKIDIAEGSKLTYVIPNAQKNIVEREGIIRFVDKDQKDDDFLAEVKNEDESDAFNAPRGLEINAIINVNEKSQFEIIIDPVAGDRLDLKGKANLSLGINPAGDISLTGPYEVYDGRYVFSFYGVVKKEFEVKRGSKLTWFGDVLNADANITALYQVEASPINLMQSQVSENTQSGIYKQKLPFIVMLNMEGKLLKPEISFELDMGDGAKSFAGGEVYGKIQSINQTESEVNKQVFALLILNRFMADNPFASAGGTTEGLVRTSVSSLLSKQLNKLTDQIDGLDIEVGLKSYEDYSSGEQRGRTDLDLGLSTNFLDDRITMKVAGNINLEGAPEKQKDLADFAGDVSIEYKLTEDGRYRLITFRKEVYEALLQGEIIETGAGFIIVKDFDKFREIFKKTNTADE